VRDYLINLFNYDQWANEKWITFMDSAQTSPEAWNVFDHILRAHTSWFSAISSDPLDEITDRLQNNEYLSARWQNLMKISDPTAFVSITGRDGNSTFMSVEQIASHVINHGTYHRGQLREIFKDQPEFPETDLIKFYRR